MSRLGSTNSSSPSMRLPSSCPCSKEWQFEGFAAKAAFHQEGQDLAELIADMSQVPTKPPPTSSRIHSARESLDEAQACEIEAKTSADYHHWSTERTRLVVSSSFLERNEFAGGDVDGLPHEGAEIETFHVFFTTSVYVGVDFLR